MPAQQPALFSIRDLHIGNAESQGFIRSKNWMVTATFPERFEHQLNILGQLVLSLLPKKSENPKSYN